jgi:hypothetical protein
VVSISPLQRSVSAEIDSNRSNIEHVARHWVTPGEVEEVFANGLSGGVGYARQGVRTVTAYQQSQTLGLVEEAMIDAYQPGRY